MKLGVIGGSGLYNIEGFGDYERRALTTPFGAPSDAVVVGKFEGLDMVFLPRHGVGHRLAPGELNHRANIWAMKSLGVTHLLSVSAVGSLAAKYAPRDVVLVDQYVDRARRGAEQSFFGDGIVAHIAFAEPVCGEMLELAHEAAATAAAGLGEPKPTIHKGGTYLNMEGPAFSTKAESKLYRSWGMDVIGMTNMLEAKLAREAEICYCCAAMVTDYDCWHPDHDHVTVDMIIDNLRANSRLANEIVRGVAAGLSKLPGKCPCPDALKFAIITERDLIPPRVHERLAPIIGKYFPQTQG